ncbi:hypothetical protein CR513_47201, partial [Mucuna pruriens]
MASNTQQFETRGVITSRVVNEVNMIDNLRLENQLTELTSLVRSGLRSRFDIFGSTGSNPLYEHEEEEYSYGQHNENERRRRGEPRCDNTQVILRCQLPVLDCDNYLEEKRIWRKSYSHMGRYEVYHEKKICIKTITIETCAENCNNYYEEVQVAMTRSNVKEDHEVTIARFIEGIKKGIVNTSKSSSKFATSSSSLWRSNWKNNNLAKYSNAPPKGKIDTNTSYRSHDTKCFRCQGVEHIASQYSNKRTMIMMDNGEVESKSSSDDEMSPLEDCSDMEVAELVDEVILVTGHAFSIQA